MTSFTTWWQNLPSHLNPVIFHIGSFRLQYYGMMYIVAFMLTYFLARHRIRRENRWELSIAQLQELLTAMVVGLVIGARLGYVLIYNFNYYLGNPLEIFLPFSFQGGFHFTGITGMSYHGGLAGSILCAWWYARKHGFSFREVADLLVPCIPIGYFFGRMGNFINGELWGRVTTAAIGMHFPNAPGIALRHPSQLYEAFGEGILLFIILWGIKNRVKIPGAMFPIYLMGYGVVRFIIEYFRQPDTQIGFVLFSFSMGQILCSLMILAGAALLAYYAKTGSR